MKKIILILLCSISICYSQQLEILEPVCGRLTNIESNDIIVLQVKLSNISSSFSTGFLIFKIEKQNALGNWVSSGSSDNLKDMSSPTIVKQNIGSGKINAYIKFRVFCPSNSDSFIYRIKVYASVPAGFTPEPLNYVNNILAEDTINLQPYNLLNYPITGTTITNIPNNVCLGSYITLYSTSYVPSCTFNGSNVLFNGSTEIYDGSKFILTIGPVTSNQANIVFPNPSLPGQLQAFINNANSCTPAIEITPSAISINVPLFPNMTGTNSVSVTEPLCLGNTANVTFNASSLANGNYSLVYSLSGSNSGTFTATNVVFASGTGTFTIPPSNLPNAGNTTISLTSISNSGCNTPITPGSITDSFIISIVANVSGTNSVTILDICIGFGATVQFNSSSLANGNYSLVYNLSGANTGTALTATNVVFASGTGTFTIPASNLPNAGITNIALTSINNIASSCQSSF